MERLIKISNKLFIDLNNYYEKIDETEDLNIFDKTNNECVENNISNADNDCKLEIKKTVDIFINLTKNKNIDYCTSIKFKDTKLDIIKLIQGINNSYMKNEEYHYLRLMMIICLKNYIFEYVNKYLKNIINNYEEKKHKKEINNFSSLIYSKNDDKTDGIENVQIPQMQPLYINFLNENIIEHSKLLENTDNNSKRFKEEEWIYLRENILLLIKNSCVINDRKSSNFPSFEEYINNNMHKSFKKYKSIIEMKKFNICLYFIDIFLNIFLIDYPYKWGNVIENISRIFKVVSIIKENDFTNALNYDYNSTINYITELMKLNDSTCEIGNVENKYRMVIHFQNLYSLMFLLNKILKKYIPKIQNRNNYSVLYHNYFISYINNDNRKLLETNDYGNLKIPCENLLSGFKDIIKIYFPFFNRLLYYLLNSINNIYAMFTAKKIIKFLYKTMLCHFSELPVDVMNNELEILFHNISKIIDIDLSEYVNNLYFINTNGTSEIGLISVSKITEESSYENLCVLIGSQKNNLVKLLLTIILKAKKWCLKILNVFLFRSIHFDEMNDTWKIILKNFENKYIIFLEKISILILKVIINTTYTDEEKENHTKLFSYIKYIINFTDYIKFSDKCLSLSINYLCMIISMTSLQNFVKQNILSDVFLNCLFIHINSSSHIECIDNFTNNPAEKDEDSSFDNLKFEKYIIWFHKIPLFRKFLLNYYDDTKSKNILKKYVNYIFFLFCELLDNYFYDIIFYLDKNVKDNLRRCLVIQNEYMHLLYPEIFINNEIKFTDGVIEMECNKKSTLLINTEICMRTQNHNIYINDVMCHISEIIKRHMKDNGIEHTIDFSYFYSLNNESFNNLIYIIKNLPLYKYSQEELIFKDLYSMENKHNINLSCLIMNDINLYKYISFFMFLSYYKYSFIKKKLEQFIEVDTAVKNSEKNNDNFDESFGNFDEGEKDDNKEKLMIDDYIEEYCKNKNCYISYFENNEITKFDTIINDFKINDKSFFFNYILVNGFHPYSNNLKRITIWMLKEYVNMTWFDENTLRFFFFICFINLFYFEKHLKFKSFNTLINFMYKFGIPSKAFYDDFREVFTFLFFQLLILFIKNEATAVDNTFYCDNIDVVLNENNEKTSLFKYITEGSIDSSYFDDDIIIYKTYLYNQMNCFSDFFINNVLYNNFNFYMEKMEQKNLNKFLNFISLFYQNEINNNIFLFISLLNDSLLDTKSIAIERGITEYSFLRILKFLSFFLEHYTNASSTQDLLVMKILQNSKFITHFKNIIMKNKMKDQINEETLNEIYYILYIFTKNSLFNYKIFWFYFLYSVAGISNSLNIFQLKEINKLEKIPSIPIYAFQFFNNLIKRDILYFFFSLAEEKPFNKININISLIEIFRKICLLLICLSDESLNEQNYCNNSTSHIYGLYLYNNLLSYFMSLLTKNNIFFTYLFWNEIKRSYDLIQDHIEMYDMDNASNYSFKKFDEGNYTEKNIDSNDCIYFDQYNLHDNTKDIDDDESLYERMQEDPYMDLGDGVYVDIEEEEEENGKERRNKQISINSKNSEISEPNFNYIDEISISSNLCRKRYESINNESINVIPDFKRGKVLSSILFYEELKNYLINKKKRLSRTRDSSFTGFNNIGVNISMENKILKLLNTIYFNMFLLKDKNNEFIRKLIKTLKYVNTNLQLNCSDNGYNLYSVLLMIQKKRYIYQSFSMYIFIDIQHFLNTLFNEQNGGSIIDGWLNDIFYIYQSSDDLKCFIFSFASMLIYLCLYEKKKRLCSASKNDNKNLDTEQIGEDHEFIGKSKIENIGEGEYKSDFFLKDDNISFGNNSINNDKKNSSMNDLDKILEGIDLEYFNVHVIKILRERLDKITKAIINAVLILPIPYEDNVNKFSKNILRRLAPIYAEGDNIQNDNLLKFLNENKGDNKCDISFNDLLENIEFMHLSDYEQKFYERKNINNYLKFSQNNIVHINKSEDLILYDKKLSVNYYIKNTINDGFLNKLVSDCNFENFKISLYIRKAFSLLTQEFYSTENLINIVDSSDKYYNFINIILMDI
ncbi:conserved Plasmodium protein, unknown function [Plasmodium chabaudi chabaudi]|uniref:Uncharacterized protein n=1 Tax=Plasmodium chabaudi chabaudi TaxID=31271 RepID=A0A1D3RZG5_PLACU|nr:conserved Plasmodium protein, unknown function [Plasmodium chabaudi chabaudi]